MSQYIDPLYTIEAFRMSYDCPINPIPSLGAPEVTKETAIILPPKTRRPRGRPKVARIRSRGKKVRQIRFLTARVGGRTQTLETMGPATAVPSAATKDFFGHGHGHETIPELSKTTAEH
ncbi:hypothetical protein Vadar_026891 [Vaccinium darrowii]|uniref:Uncharacterized protein n=1 Tax=Vaccinium darrowii TaxID=229202 RepID=A0ACB7XU51_9ERIC|nr:hypothetical protein Vadar_026891 [Vaccinium darrowii]